MNISENNLRLSANILHVVGYGLLILWFFDTVAYLTPLKFTDPLWEFETIGRMVESVGWLLIAFAMVFFGEGSYRLWFELKLLRVLSWVCLGLAIMYFAMLPLGIADTWKLRNMNDLEIGKALDQNTTPLRDLQTKLTNTKTDQELLDLFKKSLPPNTPFNVKDPQETKTKLITEIDATTLKIKAELDAQRSSKFKVLVKNSVKWNLGAILCAVLFAYLWRFSAFYRNYNPEASEEW